MDVQPFTECQAHKNGKEELLLLFMHHEEFSCRKETPFPMLSKKGFNTVKEGGSRLLLRKDPQDHEAEVATRRGIWEGQELVFT